MDQPVSHPHERSATPVSVADETRPLLVGEDPSNNPPAPLETQNTEGESCPSYTASQGKHIDVLYDRIITGFGTDRKLLLEQATLPNPISERDNNGAQVAQPNWEARRLQWAQQIQSPSSPLHNILRATFIVFTTPLALIGYLFIIMGIFFSALGTIGTDTGKVLLKGTVKPRRESGVSLPV